MVINGRQLKIYTNSWTLVCLVTLQYESLELIIGILLANTLRDFFFFLSALSTLTDNYALMLRFTN